MVQLDISCHVTESTQVRVRVNLGLKLELGLEFQIGVSAGFLTSLRTKVMCC